MGKTALVTGGAGGIGSAICRALAADGWHVAVAYHHSAEAAEALAKEIGGIAVYADVTEPDEVEAMFGQVGGVDLLVNNAGISRYGLLTDLTYQDWKDLFRANTDSVFLCCRAAIPHMVHRKRGNILNISSMWGQVGGSCEAGYSASKAAVIGLTKALAKELAPSGIRVNCIAPGCWMASRRPSWRNCGWRPRWNVWVRRKMWGIWQPSWPRIGQSSSPVRWWGSTAAS